MADNSSFMSDEWMGEQSPYFLAMCGTLFTWGVTALGAAMIYIMPIRGNSTKMLLDCSLGFAAGVMLAASYWSLLAPAIEKAEEAKYGSLAWAPVAVGFCLGAAFVAYAGKYTEGIEMSSIISDKKDLSPSKKSSSVKHKDDNKESNLSIIEGTMLRKRNVPSQEEETEMVDDSKNQIIAAERKQKEDSFRRMMALVIAITVHNIPEGLAVGVGFGGTDFKQARNLAFGIGLQNFPEGLAVSLPLAAAGESKHRAFFWGQLSGVVEPISGMLGVFFVSVSTVLLPYALGFAAGAMIYVVMDDIVPDACSRENSSLAAKFSIIGFVVMMAMDVALG